MIVSVWHLPFKLLENDLFIKEMTSSYIGYRHALMQADDK